MDPLSAISLAGNIIAFVEFGIKLTMKSSEIYASMSSETDANRAMNTITTDLGVFSENLSRSISTHSSAAEEDIASLARECAEDAVKLMRILNKLQVAGKESKKGKLPPLIPALKALWKQKDIEEIQQRLTNFRAQITLRLVALINDKHSSMTMLLVELASSTSVQLRELQSNISQIKDITYKALLQPSQELANPISVSTKLEALAKVGDNAIEGVLKSLQFDSMRTREATVAKAHTETFEWLLTDNFDFHRWLSRSAGIYWVSGKPGSGKSTLMKFLCRHAKTHEALNSWSTGDLLITASFYFWNAGTPMQKSLQGLLKSLLYEILRQCPLLIPVVTPNWWGNAFNLAIDEPWSWQEVTEAFDRFTAQTKVSCKTCLFIDGLDEYDGDHSEMVEFLFKVAKSPNLKLCLASRPYNVFEDAYGHSPDRMLRLQDLTRDDIRRYAYDNFESHQNFMRLKSFDDQYSQLIEEIVNRADGVFLWVYLVVRSLKEGLTNADTVSTLEKRLRQLPSDLQQYFTHILQSVDDVYWEGTTKVFQMTASALHLLPVGVLTILDDEDDDFCLNAKLRSMRLAEYEERVRILEKRLNARCKGLLEVRATPGHLYGSNDYNGRHLVDFLHRTVRDFLRIGEVDALLKSRLRTPFDVDVALCQGFLVQMKQFIIADDPTICRELPMIKAIEDLCYHAKRIEILAGVAPTKILDEAFRAVKEDSIIHNPYALFHSALIRHGLSRYLEYKLDSSHDSLYMDQDILPLEVALTGSDTATNRYTHHLDPGVVQVLVNHGADPNESIPGSLSQWTVWKSFIAFLTATKKFNWILTSPDTIFRTVEILLKAGAEPYEGLSRDMYRILDPHKARLLEELIYKLSHPDGSPHGNTVTPQPYVTRNNNHLTSVQNQVTQGRTAEAKRRPIPANPNIEPRNDGKHRSRIRSFFHRLE
ncbi:hypothetical protein M434DRAFT_397651 [Hypoxylon sp. CO27-5]|nr:hypothetical protein M434DRAFT_397651 [Hypoxylon sp. CO27-5]